MGATTGPTAIGHIMEVGPIAGIDGGGVGRRPEC